MSEIEKLAESWNATPDYAPTEYDQGRVDQRHEMTMQLLEAIEADREEAASALEAAADAFEGGSINLEVFKEGPQLEFWRASNETRASLVKSLRERARATRPEGTTRM